MDALNGYLKRVHGPQVHMYTHPHICMPILDDICANIRRTHNHRLDLLNRA